MRRSLTQIPRGARLSVLIGAIVLGAATGMLLPAGPLAASSCEYDECNSSNRSCENSTGYLQCSVDEYGNCKTRYCEPE